MNAKSLISRSEQIAVAALFAVTMFLSAFLIFQVQPLISKYILPWFGGTPGVWTACLLFFQSLLFGGYAYAHGLNRRFSTRAQVAVHAALLLAGVCLLPICPDASWKPSGNEPPTWWIIGLLASTVGLPYFLLSATGPLLQDWFGRRLPGVSPYRLYSLSNLGSVLGLLTYPFIVEPWLAAETQATLWSCGFAMFAVCCLACGAVTARTKAAVVSSVDHRNELSASITAAPTRSTMLLWIGLAACPSVMLLVTTNQVCLDVAVSPFLWVLPLTIYLTSFILCFDRAAWYPRQTYAIALALTAYCATSVLSTSHDSSIISQMVVQFGLLFFCCMVCHGELVRMRPDTRHLTAFYLAMSAGGALGGLLVGVAAPLCFNDYVELPAGLLVCGIIALVVLWKSAPAKPRPRNRMILGVCSLLTLVGGIRSLQALAVDAAPGQRAITRNFYGLLRVLDVGTDQPESATRRMVHGRIVHGMQFLSPQKQSIPTGYYGEETAAGLILTHRAPRKVGIVGLGVGTLATYSRPGDIYRIYEINSEVIRLAQEQFTYLGQAKGTIELVLGDARLSLDRESAQEFDLLVLDAFSSDAVPAHLLTDEAFAIYRRHLAPNGSMAIHVTNRHFDLQPVIRSAAAKHGLLSATIHSVTHEEKAQARADWMLLTSDRSLFDTPAIRAAIDSTVPSSKPDCLWTDTYNNVVGILK